MLRFNSGEKSFAPHQSLGGQMKIVLFTLTATLISVAGLTGCSSNSVPNDPDQVSVEKNIFEVSITLPAQTVEGFGLNTEDGLASFKESSGANNVTTNDDGSVTIKMSSNAHAAWMKNMKDEIDASIEESINDSEGALQKVTYNKDLTEFTVTVDRGLYESSFTAGFISFTLAFQGFFYQLFDGNQNAQTTIDIIDGATGEVISSETFPDDTEEIGVE